MERGFKFLIKNIAIFFGFFLSLLWILSGNVWGSETSQLQNFEVRSLHPNKIQLLLEFSGPAVVPQNFSVENPPTIVFDFPDVKNKLSKSLMNQELSGGILKNIVFLEAANKVRMVLNVQNVVPFEKEASGNTLKITLDESGVSSSSGKKRKKIAQGSPYEIKSFDFKRGEQGEARLIVNLSNAKGAIDFGEDGNKIIAKFIGATISDSLEKQYNVADFATPVRTVDIVRNDQDVEMILDASGNYENIGYQMDNQFIIEVRNISKEEKAALKELTGQYSGEKISLHFQDVEIRAILQIIADFSKFNVITSDSVKGNITIRLQNVPWDQALDIILKSKGLDKRQMGNVMLIAPTDELAAREKVELEGQKQIEDLGPMKSELIQINYANADDLAALLKDKTNSLMTTRGNVNVDKRTNTLLIQDVANKLVEIRSLLKKLDVPVRQVEISTQIVTANNTLESTLGMRFGGAANLGIGHRRLGVGSTADRARTIGDFTWNDANGIPRSSVPNANQDYTIPQPIVTAGASAQPQPQPVNGNIVQGALNSTPPTVNNTEGLFSDLSAVSSVSGIAPGKLGLALAKLPNGTLLDLELQALEYETKSKTIARPKIVTMDQNKATVEQGVDIPYTQSTSSGATSVTYKTAALKLEVTPHITPDDKISLDLTVSNDTQGANAPAGPVVNTNRLQTKVLVDNGETIVLGGVLQITDNKQWAKIPFFGDLPIIGALFRNKYAQYSPRELMIFLTPRIINPVLTDK